MITYDEMKWNCWCPAQSSKILPVQKNPFILLWDISFNWIRASWNGIQVATRCYKIGMSASLVHCCNIFPLILLWIIALTVIIICVNSSTDIDVSIQHSCSMSVSFLSQWTDWIPSVFLWIKTRHWSQRIIYSSYSTNGEQLPIDCSHCERPPRLWHWADSSPSVWMESFTTVLGDNRFFGLIGSIAATTDVDGICEHSCCCLGSCLCHVCCSLNFSSSEMEHFAWFQNIAILIVSPNSQHTAMSQQSTDVMCSFSDQCLIGIVNAETFQGIGWKGHNRIDARISTKNEYFWKQQYAVKASKFYG